jgi:thiol-disulfide isomerase/thioredoxin
MKNPLLRLAVAIALVFAVVEGISIYRSLSFWKPQSQVESPVGTAWLQMTLPDLQQKPQSLAQWKGQVVVLNFWASWCEPCKDEMPLLDGLQKSLELQKVRFIGVGIDEPGALRDYLKSHPVSYPVLVGDSTTLALTRPFGNSQQGLPFTLVLDRQGQVVSEKLGRIHEDDLRAAIATAGHAPQS